MEHLREGIALCEAQRDCVSRDLLLPLREDSEQAPAHWLEQQLRLLDRVGLSNDLPSQRG